MDIFIEAYQNGAMVRCIKPNIPFTIKFMTINRAPVQAKKIVVFLLSSWSTPRQIIEDSNASSITIPQEYVMPGNKFSVRFYTRQGTLNSFLINGPIDTTIQLALNKTMFTYPNIDLYITYNPSNIRSGPAAEPRAKQLLAMFGAVIPVGIYTPSGDEVYRTSFNPAFNPAGVFNPAGTTQTLGDIVLNFLRSKSPENISGKAFIVKIPKTISFVNCKPEFTGNIIATINVPTLYTPSSRPPFSAQRPTPAPTQETTPAPTQETTPAPTQETTPTPAPAPAEASIWGNIAKWTMPAILIFGILFKGKKEESK